MRFRANKLPKYAKCHECGQISRHNWLVVMTPEGKHFSAISDVRCPCGHNRMSLEGQDEPAVEFVLRFALLSQLLGIDLHQSDDQHEELGAERAGTVIPHASAKMAHH